MELHEKLQGLRKGKGLTQEELAERLFVSRAAVSKWESGRGYPSIDSLKEIARFFSVSIDDLLCSTEIVVIAEQDSREKEARFCDLTYGLLDCSSAMLLFLPFFGQRSDGVIGSVPLLALSEVGWYVRLAYALVVAGLVGMGILTLALQNYRGACWLRYKHKASLLLNVAGVLLFVIGLQPYAAVFLFLFLMIKTYLRIKKQ